jgi:hypothetical protein
MTVVVVHGIEILADRTLISDGVAFYVSKDSIIFEVKQITLEGWKNLCEDPLSNCVFWL